MNARAIPTAIRMIPATPSAGVIFGLSGSSSGFAEFVSATLVSILDS